MQIYQSRQVPPTPSAPYLEFMATFFSLGWQGNTFGRSFILAANQIEHADWSYDERQRRLELLAIFLQVHVVEREIVTFSMTSAILVTMICLPHPIIEASRFIESRMQFDLMWQLLFMAALLSGSGYLLSRVIARLYLWSAQSRLRHAYAGLVLKLRLAPETYTEDLGSIYDLKPTPITKKTIELIEYIQSKQTSSHPS